MAKKAYVSNRFKGLMVGEKIRFVNGEYATDDPDEQKAIESLDWYGIHVHPKDVEPEVEKKPRRGRESVAEEI